MGPEKPFSLCFRSSQDLKRSIRFIIAWGSWNWVPIEGPPESSIFKKFLPPPRKEDFSALLFFGSGYCLIGRMIMRQPLDIFVRFGRTLSLLWTLMATPDMPFSGWEKLISSWDSIRMQNQFTRPFPNDLRR